MNYTERIEAEAKHLNLFHNHFEGFRLGAAYEHRYLLGKIREKVEERKRSGDIDGMHRVEIIMLKWMIEVLEKVDTDEFDNL